MSVQAVPLPRKRTSQYWLNLALAGLLAFYSLYMAWQVGQHLMCSQIGVDYCEYLSAGRVANMYGYASIYNLDLLKEAQSQILHLPGGSSDIPVLPFFYLPIFVLPFQVFSLLQLGPGYWVWTAVNLALLLLYLRSFLHRAQLPPASARTIAMLLGCLPVFMNLLVGQIDIWLAVCVGESLRAMLDRRQYRAGFWLGGLVLKPQVLLVLAAFFLVQRAWRTLAGLLSICGILGLFSFLLIGGRGFAGMLVVWLTGASGTASIWGEGMMNWRMLGLQLSNHTAPWFGWSIAGLGMLATLVIVLLTWHKPPDAESPSFPLAMVGLLSASLMLAWHSHIHMAVMILPALVYAYQRRLLPQRLWDYWVFLPAAVYMFMVFVPETLMSLGLLSVSATPAIHGVIGAAEFSASLLLFIWAARSAHLMRNGDLPGEPLLPAAPAA